MRAMGFDPAPLQQVHEPASWPFILLPENAGPLDFFAGLVTQWRRLASLSGGSIFIGLDYAGVEAAMRMHGIDSAERSGLFADVQRMEVAALPVLNAER